MGKTGAATTSYLKKKIVKRFAQCHVFDQTRLGRRPSDTYQTTLCNVRDLCKSVSPAVLFGRNGNSYKICMESDMYICIYTYYSRYRDAGRAK
jgi:hypothetical protein